MTQPYVQTQLFNLAKLCLSINVSIPGRKGKKPKIKKNPTQTNKIPNKLIRTCPFTFGKNKKKTKNKKENQKKQPQTRKTL